jgi:hypothetical protein
MDSNIDTMPLLGNNKSHTAVVEGSGDETLSIEGHGNWRESDGHVVTPTTNCRTTFERKAALINAYVAIIPGETMLMKSREIDKFDFGKYQRCIWMLCGFGYFLDLAWAQGVALMASAVLYVT